jgi:predicted nucleic acid-binding protein
MENPRASLINFIVHQKCIALDSCILIYHLEGDERFAPAAREIIEVLEAGRTRAIISTLALLEIQVAPYRRKAEDLADSYYALLRQLKNCRWVDMTYEIADRAAQLRAKYRLGTPDAIHVATAIESGAAAFVTNDSDLPEMDEIQLVQVASFRP